MTAKRRVFEAVSEFIRENGYSPTVRELGILAGLKSSSTIHFHLANLKREGAIAWNPASPRTIRILKVPENAS